MIAIFLNFHTFSENLEVLYTTLDTGNIAAINKEGNEIWKTRGNGPIILNNDLVFALTHDNQKLIALNKETGEKKSDFLALKPELPYYGTSFCLLSCGNNDFLLIISPQQNRLLIIQIQKDK